MSIELTSEQAIAIAENDEIVVIDPRTKKEYRLVPVMVFRKLQAMMYDDSPWTTGETGILAGEALGKLDDTDYSEYLENP